MNFSFTTVLRSCWINFIECRNLYKEEEEMIAYLVIALGIEESCCFREKGAG